MQKLTLFFLLLFSALTNFAQNYSPEVLQLINRVENSLAPAIIYSDTIPSVNLESRMKETHIMGLSIAVIKDYKIQWAKGYGWANVESKKMVSTNTRFQAASISKSLNSMGQLKLVQQGKINGEADINNYLKSWKFPYDSLTGTKKITLFQLLSHTAGLDIHGFPGYERTDARPTLPQVLNGEKPANTKKYTRFLLQEQSSSIQVGALPSANKCLWISPLRIMPPLWKKKC